MDENGHSRTKDPCSGEDASRKNCQGTQEDSRGYSAEGFQPGRIPRFSWLTAKGWPIRSVLPQSPDLAGARWHFGFVPGPDSCAATPLAQARVTEIKAEAEHALGLDRYRKFAAIFGYRQHGSLQLFSSLKMGSTRSFPQILSPALL